MSNLSKPSLNSLAKHLTANAVAVMQSGQRPSVQEFVGQTGELEACWLNILPQQGTGHCFTQAANHRMVLSNHHYSRLGAHGCDDGRFVQWLDGGAVQHGHVDVVGRQVLGDFECTHG